MKTEQIDADGLRLLSERWGTMSQNDRDSILALACNAVREDLHEPKGQWPGRHSEHLLGDEADSAMVVIRGPEKVADYLSSVLGGESWLEVYEIVREGRVCRVIEEVGNIYDCAPPAVVEEIQCEDEERERQQASRATAAELEKEEREARSELEGEGRLARIDEAGHLYLCPACSTAMEAYPDGYVWRCPACMATLSERSDTPIQFA